VTYLDIVKATWLCVVTRVEQARVQQPVGSWPLPDIAIPNIVWCTSYIGGVGEGAYIAQWSCNNIAIG